MALMLAASSAAQAQCAFSVPGAGGRIPAGLEQAGSLPASIATSVTTVSTAFLTQTTAFVASPPASQPSQFAGGFWIRGVGGRADVDSAATGSFSVTNPALSGTFSCTSSTRSTYGGFQTGIDIGRLDLGGWNVHVGVTGGYLNMFNKTGAANVHFDVPFVGLYGAVTSGGFYIDAQIRYDSYDMSLTDPALGLAGRSLRGKGWGVTSSTGYVFNLGNFIVEPSLGVVYSRVSVDPLSFTPTAIPVPGTISFQDIESLLGRAGIRVATNWTVGSLALQPFAAVSVWHEFADDLTGTFQCAAPCGGFVNINGTAIGDRIGTFGQYSVGFAGSVPNTPWLGYVRFDYRNGDRFDSINFNGGIRYQFAPEVAPAVVRARS